MHNNSCDKRARASRYFNCTALDVEPSRLAARCFSKNEILPGEQPPIMDRKLFEAVRQKSLAQWSHRTVARSKSDELLTGLLFDDAGHRMIPTHATKVGIHYRYYASAPVLNGEAKTASAGSVSRVPAADIEDTIVKSLCI